MCVVFYFLGSGGAWLRLGEFLRSAILPQMSLRSGMVRAAATSTRPDHGRL